MDSDRILILGAGRGQTGLIKAAKSLGVTTYVASLPSKSAPGIPLADKVVYADISDPQKILSAACEEGITAVATSCADTGLPALGLVCDRLRLPGLSSAAAEICNDKLRMKRAFESYGVKTAKYRSVGSRRELAMAIKELRFPLVIKATDLQGSQGISIVRNEAEAESGFVHAMNLTHRHEVVVEQFIEGDEFGAQALVYGGNVAFVMPHGDEVFMARTAVPIGHYVPLDRGPAFLSDVAVEVEKAIRAVGINNSAVNVDLIARGDEIYVIEITGRVGANGLPELVSAHYGLNYYQTIVLLALGQDPTTPWQSGESEVCAAAARMLIAPELHGQVESITIDPVDVGGVDFTLFRGPGDVLDGFTNSGDCIGQIVTSAKSLKSALSKLEAVEKALEITMAGPADA